MGRSGPDGCTSFRAALRPIRLAILATCPAISVTAQTAPTSSWSVDALLVHTLQTDELASPLRYRGLGPGIEFGYARTGRASRTGVSLSYMRPSLSSDISRSGLFVESAHRLRVTVPYLREFHERPALTFLFGGSVGGDAYYREHVYAPASEHFLDAFLLLRVVGGVDYRRRADVLLEQRLSVAVAGVAWRGAYTGLKYGPTASFERADQLQGVTHSLVLSRMLGPGVAFRAAHEVNVLRHPDPWRLAVITQGVSIGVAWRRNRTAPAAQGSREAGR